MNQPLNRWYYTLGQVNKTIAMTMRYAHNCPESLRSSIEVLDKWYNFGTIQESGDEAGLKSGEKPFKIKHGSV
jgi:hypothetical protein